VVGEFTAVGLDVHKRSVKACAINTRTGEVSRRGFGGDPGELVAWVKGLPGPVVVVYESGPTGFWLARRLNEEEGVDCRVAATSKIPRAPGERVKTDERDAFGIATLVAGGVELKCARIPTVEEEHARDLVRGRDDVRRELMRHRQHVDALLLRRGVVWAQGRSAWVQEHMRWLARQDLGSPHSQAVYDDAVGQVIQARSRLEGFDKRIEEFAHGSSFTPVVRALECLRGVSTLTAFGLAVEVGDWDRFATARGFTSFIGLVPSEHSSGQTRSQGGLTKTGNSHARRLVTEAAWHHAKPFNPRSVPLARRQAAQADPLIRAVADKANRRLAARWELFTARKKKPVVANGAVARELACFCWELALMAG
jgi:transposase